MDNSLPVIFKSIRREMKKSRFKIWALATAKLIASHIPALVTVSDAIMYAILGIMFGRLGGIGLRVHRLKLEYGIIKKE